MASSEGLSATLQGIEPRKGIATLAAGLGPSAFPDWLQGIEPRKGIATPHLAPPKSYAPLILKLQGIEPRKGIATLRELGRGGLSGKVARD